MSDIFRNYRFYAFIFVLFLTIFSISSAQSNGDILVSATEKGNLVADYWVNKSGASTGSDYYADICSFYGACIFGEANKDSSYLEEINSRYTRTSPILTDNIDHNSCGILPLHLYLYSGNSNHLKLGTDAADANIQADGHFRNASDDTYMTGSLLVQAYRATEDDKYLDFCADYIVRYINSLQQSNGLYQHGANGSKQYWGRGNGWASAASAELLQVIPEDHEKYDEVVTGFKNHMKGLIDVQLESGMWPQLLGSDDSRNWEETSGTSMFLYGLFTGLELGFLDKETFLEPAENGWNALIGYLSSDGKLGNIAEGFWPSSGTAEEYLNAKKASAGNSHGTAGFLWAATAIVRYYSDITTINTINSSKFIIHQQDQEVNFINRFQPDALFDLRGRKLSDTRYRFNDMALPTGVIIRLNNTSIKKMLKID